MLSDEQGIVLILHVHIFETGDPSASDTQTKINKAKQRKREREKARRDAMTQAERDEKNKKRRQAYHLRKSKTTLAGGSRGDTMAKIEPIYTLSIFVICCSIK
jgi:type VI protein secretion system component VasA